MQLAMGTRLSYGRYTIKECIGDGGFGITYVAYDDRLDREVVLKEYFPDYMAKRDTTISNEVRTDSKYTNEMSVGIGKFMNEARTLAHLNHIPAIATVYDFFEENSTAYIVMEYIKGNNLKTIIKERTSPYSFDEAMNIISPCMFALQKIHETGIIHRDFAPDNIIINERGQVKIIDFGASRDFVSSGATMTIMVKHGYAPFEQYSNAVKQGPYTDVYSLAAILYEMLTLVKPIPSTDRILSDALVRPSEINPYITPSQDNAVMKGLAVVFSARYQTVDDFLNDLMITDNPVEAQPVQPQVFSINEQNHQVENNNSYTYVPSDDTLKMTDYSTEVVSSVPEMDYATEMVSSMPITGETTEVVNYNEPVVNGDNSQPKGKQGKEQSLLGNKIAKRLVISCVFLAVAIAACVKLSYTSSPENAVYWINRDWHLRPLSGALICIIALISIGYRLFSARRINNSKRYSEMFVVIQSFLILTLFEIIFFIDKFHWGPISRLDWYRIKIYSTLLLPGAMLFFMILLDTIFTICPILMHHTDAYGYNAKFNCNDTIKKNAKLLGIECVTSFAVMEVSIIQILEYPRELRSLLDYFEYRLITGDAISYAWEYRRLDLVVKSLIIIVICFIFILYSLNVRNKVLGGIPYSIKKEIGISIAYIASILLVEIWNKEYFRGYVWVTIAAAVIYEIFFIVMLLKKDKSASN